MCNLCQNKTSQSYVVASGASPVELSKVFITGLTLLLVNIDVDETQSQIFIGALCNLN